MGIFTSNSVWLSPEVNERGQAFLNVINDLEELEVLEEDQVAKFVQPGTKLQDSIQF